MFVYPKKYRGKYRIESNRLKDWNYASSGYYFITICTHNKVQWFGKVEGDQMILSDTGVIVAEYIEKIEQLHTNTYLEGWVVMPNHLHAIIVVQDRPGNDVETPH